MSLRDPDDEYDELVPSSKNPLKKLFNGSKKVFALVLIGLIIGVALTILVINPLLNQAQADVCKDCFYAKELLNKENDCLYSLVPNPKTVSEECGAQKVTQTNTMPPIQKDFNEETNP
jgi:hypothetical protein